MQDFKSQMLGMVEAWSQKFNIPAEEMRARLQAATPIQARFPGQSDIEAVYMETDVRRVCADLLSDQPPT